MPETRKLERAAICYGLLAFITLAVYLPVLEASFVTFDDTYYLTENATVQAGLTWEGTRWAFTRSHAANWHPLTWLSHMLDCQLYGLKPAGHHLTSLLFHTANTLMLFGLLKRLTGSVWRSAFVAALFALHPLHVESVAWVAERKDVLSTFFFLLTLLAYARYARKSESRSPRPEGNPKAELRSQRVVADTTSPHSSAGVSGTMFHLPSSIFYSLSLLCFALGLMSKPMLVTVPFVLLLLDYWPLGRLQISTLNPQPSAPQRLASIRLLLAEKIPFLLLSAASCVVTLIAQHQGGALASFEGESAVSLGERLINTPISYAWYLAKMIWPSDLAVIYPFVREWPLSQVLLATALLLTLTGAALWQGRSRPYLLVGWLWYLGTLVPVIGLVKVGVQSIADRYMYIPSIGLFVMLAWGVAELTAGWAHRAVLLSIGAAAALMACALVAGAQLLHWLDTESLFRHTLAVTRNNYLACNNLGYYLARQGQLDLAKKYYRSAIEIAPNYAGARNNLGATLVQEKKYEEAVAVLEDALRVNPRLADAKSNLALARARQGKLDEAADGFRQALALQPRLAAAHYGLGEVLVAQGKLDEAIAQFSELLRLQPNHPAAHCHLAAALASQHKIQEAVSHYRKALEIVPDLPEALNNLAWILAANPDARVRNGQEAVRLAEQACKLTEYEQPLLVGTLAAAYAEAGRFDEAVATSEKAQAMAEQSNQADLASKNRELLKLYRSGQPHRDIP